MKAAIAAWAGRFDRRVDASLEPLRARASIGSVFRFASRAGDFSMIWITIGLFIGLVIDRHLGHTAWFSAFIGAESVFVNQGVKRLFRRTRPTTTGDARYQVRKPRTSSFPSGHATSGFFAATLLTAWMGWPGAPLWFFIAVVVASSRAFIRIHHASDVVAGAAFGLTVGLCSVAAGGAHLLTR